MGFPKIALPSTKTNDVHSCVPLPVARTVQRFGLLLPRTGHVPTSWFLTTLPDFSVVNPAGLLRPAADHGVHRVSTLSRIPRGLQLSGLPRRSTLRSFSLASSHPLPGFYPHTVDLPKKTRSQGFCPLRESVASHQCCHSWKLVAPLGFSFSNHVLRLPGNIHPRRGPHGPTKENTSRSHVSRNSEPDKDRIKAYRLQVRNSGRGPGHPKTSLPEGPVRAADGLARVRFYHV